VAPLDQRFIQLKEKATTRSHKEINQQVPAGWRGRAQIDSERLGLQQDDERVVGIPSSSGVHTFP